jgi:peptide/nickel transport system substrate-binding protein
VKTRTIRRAFRVTAVAAAASLALAACGSTAKTASALKSTKNTKTTATASKPFTYASGWSPGWTYNPFASNNFTAPGLVLVPLAYQLPSGHNRPELAASWTHNSAEAIIHLRKGLKWQNGTPLTSTDIVDSAYLYGVFQSYLEGSTGNDLWGVITSISAPNKYEVIFKFKPHQFWANASYDLLSSFYPVPAFQYGKFLTPTVIKDVETGNTNALKSVAKSIEKYNPPLIGDGPLKLVGVTTGEASFVKSPTFYDASKVHVDKLLDYNTSASSVGSVILYSGKVDFAQIGISYLQYKRFERVPDAHVLVAPGDSSLAVYFSCNHYPTNLAAVRKAVAYIVNRADMVAVSGSAPLSYVTSGSSVVGSPAGRQYGIMPSSISEVGRAKIDTLPRYAPNKAKAAALLRSVGFSEKKGVWYTSKGTPFVLNIEAPSGNTGWIAAATSFASQLSSFGIKSKVKILEAAEFESEQSAGKFLAWMEYGGFGSGTLGFLPWDYYTEDFSSKGDPGLGFGPVVDLPGYGKINVRDILQQYNTVEPQSARDKLAWDWIRLTSEQLPFMTWDYSTAPVEYTTAHYTDFPPKKSFLWTMIPNNQTQTLGLMLQEGYIRPVS